MYIHLISLLHTETAVAKGWKCPYEIKTTHGIRTITVNPKEPSKVLAILECTYEKNLPTDHSIRQFDLKVVQHSSCSAWPVECGRQSGWPCDYDFNRLGTVNQFWSLRSYRSIKYQLERQIGWGLWLKRLSPQRCKLCQSAGRTNWRTSSPLWSIQILE